MFATHYHELSSLEGVLEGVKNYNISAKKQDGTLIFLRKIIPEPRTTAMALKWRNWQAYRTAL